MTVSLDHFITDCQLGNGSTSEDIKYIGNITVKVKNGSSLDVFSIKEFTSPTTAVKDPVDILDVRVPTDVVFTIVATIDGQECSLCQKAYCNAYNVNGYQVNNGYAFWQGSLIFSPNNIPSNNIITLSYLDTFPRSGVFPPCPCTTQL